MICKMSKITLNQIFIIFLFNLIFGVKEIKPVIKAMNSLNKVLDFMLEDGNTMVVDGVFGVSLVIAHLTKSLEKNMSLFTRNEVLLLKEKAGRVFVLYQPQLKSYSWKYSVFNNYIIVPEFWMHPIHFSHGKLNPWPVIFPGPYNVSNCLGFERYIFESAFDEETSDNCLVEVVIAPNDKKKPHHCLVSKACYEYMIKRQNSYDPHLPGYGNFLLKRVLFLQIIKRKNCFYDKTIMDNNINHRCSYILWELRQNIACGHLHFMNDLFFEQIAICGQEGFEEFLQTDFLEYLMEQQHTYGGFGIKKSYNYTRLLQVRVRRESNYMKYGAESHTTGLAAADLALFIRYLLDTSHF